MESLFNENAKVILTQEFQFPTQPSFPIYSLPSQVEGSLSYKIFINQTLIDSGTPKFGSGGSGPISPSLFVSGSNTLRVEIDPHPEVGEFEKDSAIDVAIVGASPDDMVSSRIDENQNIIVRVTSSGLYVDKEAVAKAAEEKKNQTPMTKEDYDVWFSKEFPEGLEKLIPSLDTRTIVGPFFIGSWTAHNEVNPSADLYTLKIPNIQGNKDRIRIEFSKVLTKKGNNVMVNDSFSTGNFFRGIELGEAAADVSDEAKEGVKGYYHGYVKSPSILDVVAGDFEFSEGFSGYEGKIIVSLPLTDGGIYEKEFPFVLK